MGGRGIWGNDPAKPQHKAASRHNTAPIPATGTPHSESAGPVVPSEHLVGSRWQAGGRTQSRHRQSFTQRGWEKRRRATGVWVRRTRPCPPGNGCGAATKLPVSHAIGPKNHTHRYTHTRAHTVPPTLASRDRPGRCPPPNRRGQTPPPETWTSGPPPDSECTSWVTVTLTKG